MYIWNFQVSTHLFLQQILILHLWSLVTPPTQPHSDSMLAISALINHFKHSVHMECVNYVELAPRHAESTEDGPLGKLVGDSCSTQFLRSQIASPNCLFSKQPSETQSYSF